MSILLDDFIDEIKDEDLRGMVNEIISRGRNVVNGISCSQIEILILLGTASLLVEMKKDEKTVEDENPLAEWADRKIGIKKTNKN